MEILIDLPSLASGYWKNLNNSSASDLTTFNHPCLPTPLSDLLAFGISLDIISCILRQIKHSLVSMLIKPFWPSLRRKWKMCFVPGTVETLAAKCSIIAL